jgi:hypothetical protein
MIITVFAQKGTVLHAVVFKFSCFICFGNGGIRGIDRSLIAPADPPTPA